ncbi:hypothetical protein M422DRAFT_250524 [Sphaerobolus stellatus SS14]|uniref:NADP-dependent oxidoreductase domain-containing protein n=1 Tax=Sphaerobolus stellatus (strain SS14) TaxID=990650 RepID=A0A0C9UTB9_SPHS4|nr:hypothetical protein M422DRAFT_250524 [Sphaerobolus stellatus SS14]
MSAAAEFPKSTDWVINEDKALPMLRGVWDLGINTIDTANIYSSGESERIITKFIQQYNILRHEIMILSKCYFLVLEKLNLHATKNPEYRDEAKYINQYGLSRTAIFYAVKASLVRLETSYIDLSVSNSGRSQTHRVVWLTSSPSFRRGDPCQRNHAGSS